MGTEGPCDRTLVNGFRAGAQQAEWRAEGRGQLSRSGQASVLAWEPRTQQPSSKQNPAQAQRHVLTSLSWKGLERMVRVPSSMDFWILAGICSPRNLS